MALETVVFPHELFGYTCKEWCASVASEVWNCEFDDAKEYDMFGGLLDEIRDPSCYSIARKVEYDVNYASSEAPRGVLHVATEVPGRKKRGRTKTVKNKEEVESQRMTHIAVERNRRKQMNEYLAVLRSLMPPSYVQRGDQASIVGGAINYVKELEQLLQSLEVQKRLKQQEDNSVPGSPFSEFFMFPQYSSCSSNGSNYKSTSPGVREVKSSYCTHEKMAENRSAMADIEVIMVDSHANLKVQSKRSPRQLVKLTAGLQCVKLIPLHLNVTTVDQMVLYSFSLKVEDDCPYSSVDEIATAVHQMLERIEEETKF